MFYQQDFIKAILSHKNNNISKLAVKYTELTESKGMYAGKCPIHKGTVEEFVVNPKTNTWYCPTCGESGNVISFIMRVKNCDFDAAVCLLAQRAGVAVPEIEMKIDDNSIFYQINRDAARFYCEQLEGSAGYDYFKDRELELETIIKFRLGYSPKYGNSLYNYLVSLGYRNDILLKSGLIGINARGEYYDKFWSRVMYPIINKDNLIIGFGGRVLDDSKPKYLNSQTTAVFDKRKNLYGFNYAQNTKQDYFICCEGYMDTIAMHQAGFDNAVASLGTALTEEQVHIIAERTNQVYLAYDSDGPGVSAAIRAVNLFKKENVRTGIINMSPCKDPDEFIKTFGKEEFLQRVSNAEDSQHFIVRKLKEKHADNLPQFYSEALDILLEEGA